MTPNAKRREYLRQLFPTINIVSPRGEGHTWDGNHTLRVLWGIDSWVHELAHWCVATPRERKFKEYGLGSHDENPHSQAKTRLGLWTRQKRETDSEYFTTVLYFGLNSVVTKRAVGYTYPRIYTEWYEILNTSPFRRIASRSGLSDLYEDYLIQSRGYLRTKRIQKLKDSIEHTKERIVLNEARHKELKEDLAGYVKSLEELQ